VTISMSFIDCGKTGRPRTHRAAPCRDAFLPLSRLRERPGEGRASCSRFPRELAIAPFLATQRSDPHLTSPAGGRGPAGVSVSLLTGFLHRKSPRLVLLALVSLLLAACATDSSVPLVDTGPPKAEPIAVTVPPVDPRPLPSEAPRGFGIETRAAAEYRRLVSAFGGEYRNDKARAYLEPLLRRVEKSSENDTAIYRLTMLNSPSVNAFALPSGDIFVSRGLLALANDSSEIAAVLAHEVAHVTSRHAFARAALERRSQIVSRVAAEVLNDPTAGQLVRDQGKIEVATFSRAQEIEADLIGVRTTARAGFDPFGATRFLTTLGRSTEQRDTALQQTSTRPDFLATHPTTPERIQAALFAARQLSDPSSNKGERDKRDFLAAINGMVFGDDVQSGVIEGVRYVHPRLGFTLNAPDGFKLDQSSQSLLGVGKDATEALRFDAVKLDPSDTLESYLARGLIEDVPTTDIRSLAVNGLTAATALSRGKDWTFRFGVFQLGGTVYRLILASQHFDDATDARFLAALNSFRKLSPAEATAIRNERISIITAAAGDTAASLGARMTEAGGEAAFRVLNGLEAGKEPTVGESYKLIAK
jgi:predicted Zn-dependent protease